MVATVRGTPATISTTSAKRKWLQPTRRTLAGTYWPLDPLAGGLLAKLPDRKEFEIWGQDPA
eukprot:4968747-Lingulodinium_polyedra.AAC.1